MIGAGGAGLVVELLGDRQRFQVPLLGGAEVALLLRNPPQLVQRRGPLAEFSTHRMEFREASKQVLGRFVAPHVQGVGSQPLDQGTEIRAHVQSLGFPQGESKVGLVDVERETLLVERPPSEGLGQRPHQVDELTGPRIPRWVGWLPGSRAQEARQRRVQLADRLAAVPHQAGCAKAGEEPVDAPPRPAGIDLLGHLFEVVRVDEALMQPQRHEQGS